MNHKKNAKQENIYDMKDFHQMNDRYDVDRIFHDVRELLLADAELEVMNLSMQKVKSSVNNSEAKKLNKLICFNQMKIDEIDKAKKLEDLHMTLDSAVFHVLTPFDIQMKLIESKYVAYDAHFNPVFLSEDLKAKILQPYRIKSKKQVTEVKEKQKQGLLAKIKQVFKKDSLKQSITKSDLEK